MRSGSFVFQSIARSEPQACNGFPILSFPQRIFLHSLLGEKKKPDPLPLSSPSDLFGAGVFSFQTPRQLIQALEPMGITVEESRSLGAERFYFEGEPEMNIARNESTRIMHALLRDGFERRCLAAGLDLNPRELRQPLSSGRLPHSRVQRWLAFR